MTSAPSPPKDDPNQWLEDEILGTKQLEWVQRKNKECIRYLNNNNEEEEEKEKDDDYIKQTKTYQKILSILNSKERIPDSYRICDKYYYNFWRDENHVCGIWRRTTLESLLDKEKETKWETVLDLDLLPPPPLPYQDELDNSETTTKATSDVSSSSSSHNKTWVWHGSILLDEGRDDDNHPIVTDRVLIKLSPGGSDADICREFDLTNQRFVEEEHGGFEILTPAKTYISYRNRNEVYIGTDFKKVLGTNKKENTSSSPSSLTNSGYPRIIKSWKRGTPLKEAETIFEVQSTDISAGVYTYHDRGFIHEFQLRTITFYETERWYRSLSKDELSHSCFDNGSTTENEFRKVCIPKDAELSTFANRGLVTLRSDLNKKKRKVAAAGRSTTENATESTTFLAGSLLAVPLSNLLNDDNCWSDSDDVVQLFTPTKTKSLLNVTFTKDYVVLKVLQDVCASLVFWMYDVSTGKWSNNTIADEEEKANNDDNSGASRGDCSSFLAVPVGEDIMVESHCRNNETDNLLWIWRDGYLVPETLEMASVQDLLLPKTKNDATDHKNTIIVQSRPAMFDARNLCVEQKFAKSLDGTSIPYFIIRRKDAPMDGSNPTLIDAYGGFEHSMIPHYSGGVSVGWLERDGIKVIANIRGGGEYGPSWHKSALREKRHKCFEDVEAIAQALIQGGLTSVEKLALIGGSNGGLLVGNIITRSTGAKLFGAAVCQVPLLDMKRYSHLLAGASWIAEYGDPDDPDDWVFLRCFSPYHVLRHDILGIPEKEERNMPSGNQVESNDGNGKNSGESENLASTQDNYKNWKCPKILFTTSTMDDRVHPGHARKMVSSLTDEAGLVKAPVVYYWENIEGGHGGAADNAQIAEMWTLTYEFLVKALDF